jgi:SAM-dependent MidA family methyltransferase
LLNPPRYDAFVRRFTDEFESGTESGPLVRELCHRITRDGPITFADFMEAALYHPQYGYYVTHGGRAGRGGDFLTSPETHAIFGSLVAKQLRQMWEIMSCPGRFTAVEAGAGRGLLARDVLLWARRRDRAFADALHYVALEPLPSLRRVQAETLAQAGLGDAVDWRDRMPHGLEGCVLSNELVDSFPVHRVIRRGTQLFEVHVTCAEGRFSDELLPLHDERIAAYFDRLGLLPGDGCFAEVNLAAPEWIASVARAMRRGYVLTFDYGYETAQLYAPWRRDGTLLCFYRHAAGSDPYQRVGQQDITSSVDFTTLRLAGEAAGLHTAGFTDQASFLVRLGIHAGVSAATEGRGDDMEEYFARRQAVMSLIDPGKLGRIKVLLQSKGIAEAPLWGFTDD